MEESIHPPLYHELRKWAIEEMRSGNEEKAFRIADASLLVSLRYWKWLGSRGRRRRNG
ncbi:hypothetical protein DEAC_c13900 [Desulfosporosinus acididurans]|uniref:Uncharacterized protein n=1 Tax=Desulfosporosinus acididurans TaxID=476652 RepID=A0A0J1FTV5_9FIRM|nr:hypothetical protein DEAC_c13900 [Desulfosporosinus acididurans]